MGVPPETEMRRRTPMIPSTNVNNITILSQTYNAGKFRLKPQNKPAYPAGELDVPVHFA